MNTTNEVDPVLTDMRASMPASYKTPTDAKVSRMISFTDAAKNIAARLRLPPA
jgi:hypothetical protein